MSHPTTVVPALDDRLRRDKGIMIGELLTVLSMSTEGYEDLKAGTPQETVKTLSRLHRYCAKRGMVNGAIVGVCHFKAMWDVWRTIERPFLNSADYVQLSKRAGDVVQAGYDIDRMAEEAKAIAKQFAGLTATPLTPEHVLGLIFGLAAQSEAVSPRQRDR